jgi:hypothetical protein
MAINTQGAVEVPLSLFGGIDTEMSPSDLPEGVSPDCGDVVFLPGSVSTRFGMEKRFTVAFPADVVYEDSFVTNNGAIKNLYLCADGSFWVEDLSSPGVKTELFTTFSGSFGLSCTAFGRQFIALSDGRHGLDIPRQFDGVNIDRVTQDGPGAPPSIANYIIPQANLVNNVAGTGISVVSSTPGGAVYYPPPPPPPNYYGGYTPPQGQGYTVYTTLTIVTSTPHGVTVGQTVSLSGSTAYNFNSASVAVVIDSTTIEIYRASPDSTEATGGTLTPFTAGLIRRNGVVTATTSTAHNLQPGFQTQIAGVPLALVGNGISSISISNENNPGLATITTYQAHGLVPQNEVVIKNVPNTAVGGAITAAAISGNVATITTTTAHTLGIGSEVEIAGVTATQFNGQFTVLSVPSSTTFTYALVDADTSSSGGTVSLVWPIASTDPTQVYFQVQTAPSPTTFTVTLSYPDGTWNGGGLYFAWEGTFYVQTIPSDTTFTYTQQGPDANSSTGGTSTPYGQASPGVHNLVVIFQTRKGYLTMPSPPVQFTAPGGQFLTVSNIPIGPPNTVARVLAFTGAGGASYFYIPVAAQENSQVVSTSTVVQDNTTTTAIVDFSDNTLFASLGISIPGNNLFNQVVLGPVLGFKFYRERLIAWGERNKVQNLLNMGFEGGYVAGKLDTPLGWTVVTSGGTLVTNADAGMGMSWQITGDGTQNPLGQISQNAYQDTFGVPILQPNTQYTFRCLPTGATSGTLIADFYSAKDGVLATASIALNTASGFAQADFSAKTPLSIPYDTVIRVYATGLALGATVTVDEMEGLYTDFPYLDTVGRFSYINNPEAFDGVTGLLGPATDTTPIRNFSELRDTLYIHTASKLHETSDSGTNEPSTWTVEQVADDCGLISAFGLAEGEEFLTWASDSGVRIFAGEQPWKISQEMQPDWEQINPSATKTVWLVNDPVARQMYVGLPLGNSTSPSMIRMMSYKELDTARQISTSPPIHISFTGKMIASDLTRKWAPWNRAIPSAAIMWTSLTKRELVLGAANVYTLNPLKDSDDDFGTIPSYYTTYFFVPTEMEQQLQLQCHRKIYCYLTAQLSGVGTVSVTPLANSLDNPYPSTSSRTLVKDPMYDLEWGLNVVTPRCAFKIVPSPLPGSLDCSFTLQKLVISIKPAAHLPIRGAA